MRIKLLHGMHKALCRRSVKHLSQAYSEHRNIIGTAVQVYLIVKEEYMYINLCWYPSMESPKQCRSCAYRSDWSDTVPEDWCVIATPLYIWSIDLDILVLWDVTIYNNISIPTYLRFFVCLIEEDTCGD